MSPEEILEKLDPEQREIAQSIGEPLRVLAGAGTGKTRAMTHRIAYAVSTGRYRPQNILAVTFTTKAAAEMASRLEQLGVIGVQARTFHSAALRQVQHFWQEAFGGEPHRVIQNKAPLIGQACTEQGLIVSKQMVKDIASEIDWAKVNMLTVEQYLEHDRKLEIPNVTQEIIAKLYDRFERIKREQGVIDLEDVLLLCSAMIEENERIAAQIHGQYKHFVVDEYQDVSPLQHAVLKSWLGKRTDVCVVGDPSQTIYSFSGASQDYLMNFSQDFPNAVTERLIRNYRSTPEIIRLANKVLSSSRHQNPLELISQQSPGVPVEFTQYATDEAEALDVAEKIARLVEDGVKASQIAVLYRTNFQSLEFEQALAELGISYHVHGQERYFSRPEVRKALSLFQRNKQLETTTPVPTIVLNLLERLEFDPGTKPTTPEAKMEWESLEALLSLAEEWVRENSEGSFAQFVDVVMARAKKNHAPKIDAVTLASFHATKGLEYPHVFLTGVREGLVPITHALTIDQIEEERRLFYVAITRAMETLHISWSEQKKAGHNQGKSRFLVDIDPENVKIEEEVEKLFVQKQSTTLLCKTCGRDLVLPSEIMHGRCESCPAPDVDKNLFKALDVWRVQKARSLKVPQVKVLSKRAMYELAETHPKTMEDLKSCSVLSEDTLEEYADELLTLLAGSEAQKH